MRITVIFILFIVGLSLSGQQPYPIDYFRSPVDNTIFLSGTFGELRGGHFHSGIDIKTGGVAGKKIYAVADGYVSRIRVSPTGFGKTLYITHPNGYVSVYAHLSRFDKEIAAYVKEQQYRRESFEINLFPDRGSMAVSKGDVIAFSGNSGGSNGPHLHFEIRLEATQTPVNPLFFGFEVKDFIRPSINWMKVIPSGPGSLVDGREEAKVYRIDGWGEQHRIRSNDTLRLSGPFSLAINTWDKLNGAGNRNGVFEVSLYADGELMYRHAMDKFDFSETRYINSLIDYAEYVENRRRYQRTRVDPNNNLSIYRDVTNNGLLYFDDDDIHVLEYVIQDFNGNVSRLPFVIRTTTFTDPAGFPPPEDAVYFSIGKNNIFDHENVRVEVPGNALYRDLWFEYQTAPEPANSYSRIHSVHDKYTPLHKHIKLTIIPDSIPAHTDKLCMARLGDDGELIYSGGAWDQGAVVTRTRSFGDYIIVADTVAPEIHSVNISSGIIKPGRLTVKLKVKDDLSGVSEYRATLNGAWLLMEYDPKNELLVYYIDERLKKGDNSFSVKVVDGKGNEKVFHKLLVRK